MLLKDLLEPKPCSGWPFSELLTDGGGQNAPFPKTCHTYPTKMKLGTIIPYLKKTQKIYESRNTPLEFCWYQHFYIKNQQILLYQKIKIQIALLHIISKSFNFFWVFKDFLINTVKILIRSAKLASAGPLKVKIFQNKSYGVIIVAYDIANKILSRDSSYIVDLFMWPKFKNSSIFMKAVIITSVL